MSVPVIWMVGIPPNMLSVQCGTSPSRRCTSRASLDMPMLFWMSPCCNSLSSSITGDSNMDAAKNITTTDMVWGRAAGSHERKSKEVMNGKLGRVRASTRSSSRGNHSFTSSKSTYSPSFESSARRGPFLGDGGGAAAPPNLPRLPPKARSSQRQMNQTPTMYTTVRSSPKNMRRRSTYLLKYRFRSL